jgi:hypothetical protein
MCCHSYCDHREGRLRENSNVIARGVRRDEAIPCYIKRLLRTPALAGGAREVRSQRHANGIAAESHKGGQTGEELDALLPSVLDKAFKGELKPLKVSSVIGCHVKRDDFACRDEGQWRMLSLWRSSV